MWISCRHGRSVPPYKLKIDLIWITCVPACLRLTDANRHFSREERFVLCWESILNAPPSQNLTASSVQHVVRFSICDGLDLQNARKVTRVFNKEDDGEVVTAGRMLEIYSRGLIDKDVNWIRMCLFYPEYYTFFRILCLMIDTYVGIYFFFVLFLIRILVL